MRVRARVGSPLARALAGLLLAGPLLAGCVAPAPTDAAYRSKAARTANDALSQVETARMAVDASQRGRLTQAYLEVLLSGAEDSFGSVQQTFDSVQPPDDPASDKVRDTLDGLLSGGADGLSALRIAARRHDTGQLRENTRALELVASGLSTFDPANPA